MRALIILSACSATLGCQAESSSEPLRAARFDETDLCYPASYSPDTSFMNAFLAPIAGQLDSSEGQELIYIPAKKIKMLVPEYTERHVNSHGVDFAHDLRGIAYSMSSVGSPNGSADQVWNVRAGSESYFVEPDPELPFFRIYPFPEPLFMWSLVKSPPPEKPSGAPPEDWYIGSCLEMAGGFHCSQTTIYRSVFYEYELQQQDLHLRNEVRSAVIQLLRKWHDSCGDE